MARLRWQIRYSTRVTVVGALMFVAGGCYLTPNFGSPGTIGTQRNRAVLHDPYPNNDVGPAIVSGRPLGFERPLSEPAANQISPHASRGSKAQPYFGF